MQHADTSLTTVLQRFIQFENMGHAELQALAKYLRVEFARPGQCLFRAGDTDRRDIFLISGELKLIAEDGRAHLVTAHSGAARHPIARLRPRRYTAEAKTVVEYFLIEPDNARRVTAPIRLRHEPLEAIEVAEISLEAFQMAQAEYLQKRRSAA